MCTRIRGRDRIISDIWRRLVSMTERQFIFWLKGYILDKDVIMLDKKQVSLIKKNLSKISEQYNVEESHGDDDR